MELPFELNEKIVEFLESLPNIHNENGRLVFVLTTGLDERLQMGINFSGPIDQFCQLLVHTLVNYGKLQDGRNALESLLDRNVR